MLSDKSAGVFFNDSTKIVVSNNDSVFYYYERRQVNSNEKQDVQMQYRFSDYPKELQKKVTLLEHFKSYLSQNKVQSSSQPESDAGRSRPSEPGSVYVKKWMKTNHATMFRLSNKIVQVNFKDRTEILLNSESRQVTYVNKKGERCMMPLSQALDSNDAEMTKRLKYTKDILTSMLNNGQHAQAPTSAQPASAAMGSRRSNRDNPSSLRLQSATSNDRRQMQGSSSKQYMTQYNQF